MQLQNTNRSAQRSISPKRAAKMRGQSSNKNAGTVSFENTTRSFRQASERANVGGAKRGRRSKKDNRRVTGQLSETAANKRRSPVEGGRNAQAKRRVPQGAQRAKELKGMTTGYARPGGGAKGSSAKRARSRR